MAGAAVLKHLGGGALRLGPVARAARRIGALRGRSLVLVYHRVSPEGPGPSAIVPCLEEALFRRHVEALGDLGELVPLQDLVRRPGVRKLRFALTFDDDHDTHARWVLPVLSSLGVPGTFFLSGRSLHGLGPYWFEALEGLLRAHPLEEVARLLGVAGGGTVGQLALACERDVLRQRRLEQVPLAPVAHLTADQIATLAATSTVGFHTLHHRVLTALPTADLERELTEGRELLATAAGQSMDLFAYPHGKADAKVAARVRAAGYTAAWTGLPVPSRPGADPFLLGRWDPGALSVDELVVKVAIRLNRTQPAVAS